MKNLSIAALSLALCAAPVVQAEFELVNNFESGDTAGVTFVTSPLAADGGNGSIEAVADPADASNTVLQLNPGVFANDTDTNNTWFYLTLPDITGKATLYSRISRGDLVDIVWGTSPTAEPGSYGDFSSALRMEIDGLFDYREGSEGYLDIIGGSSESGAWYETWFVIDVATNTYDAWIKGGTVYATATKVVTGAAFRNQSTDPQNRFYARATTGAIDNPKGVDPVYFDDIYVDLSGENVTTPGSGSGGGGGPVDLGTGRMSNIATRGFAGTGDQVMTGGFVIGDGGRRVLIRAVGPTLGGFGVAGTIADPVLTLIPAGGTVADAIAVNDNWGDNDNADEIVSRSAALGAFALGDGSADAVLLLTLDAGGYTAQVTGADGGTGVAIIEVYEVR